VSSRPTLEEARARLKELGYLDARVERLLFRPVFAGRGGAFLPAIVIGAAAAALAAVASVEAAEAGFSSARAALALFAHIFASDLLPAALLAFGVAYAAEKARAPGLAATLAGAGAALLVFALWIAGTYGLARELSTRALLWGVPVAIAALLLATAVRLSFLARAFARSGTLPRRANRRVFAAAAALGLLVAILLFFSRREAAPVPAPQPSPRSSPIVVLAVDGLDLDGPGKDPAVAALLARGATGWWPAEHRSPPEIWTTIATGTSATRHGVRSLARVRPAGSPLPLRPPFGTSWYLRHLGPVLGLVSNAPVSSADRRTLDFWEVSASAGIPSLSIGWWAAGPWPGATVIENRAVLARAKDGVDADRVALDLFAEAVRRGYGVATVYLPGCDIAREQPGARQNAVAAVSAWLTEWVARAERGDVVLVVVAADSHPASGEALGRMVVFDGPGAPRTVRVRPEDVAPSVLARIGVPPALDLGGRPVAALFTPGSLETVTVASYGPRVAPARAAAPESDREYLEKLRALGYLQ
jgi:hypothetical protein